MRVTFSYQSAKLAAIFERKRDAGENVSHWITEACLAYMEHERREQGLVALLHETIRTLKEWHALGPQQGLEAFSEPDVPESLFNLGV